MAGPYTATGVTRMAEKGNVDRFHTTRPSHRAIFIEFYFSDTILSAPKSLSIF